MTNVIWLSHGLHHVNTNVYQNVLTIFHSVQEIGPFSLFQNLELGKASTNEKCHFAISWTRCHQYQCVCKLLLKYSKRFKSYRHCSRTGRRQNLHKVAGDKIKCLFIGNTMKVNLQFQLNFLGSCNRGRILLPRPLVSKISTDTART